MPGFTHTKLDQGEEIVIGPVTSSSSSSFSVSSGTGQGAQMSRTNQRIVGITNQRVIVEQGGRPNETQIVANTDVRRIYVKRERFGLKVERIETHRGQLKLDLGGLRPPEEARLFELFPNAEIGEVKGLFGGFKKLTPQSVPAPMPARPPAPRPQASQRAAPAPRPAATAAVAGVTKSHIDDPDVKTLDDLRRCYPLPAEYEYVQAADGDFVVRRVSDGAQFVILAEEGLLGFDVPVQDPKRKKITVEVFKKA